MKKALVIIVMLVCVIGSVFVNLDYNKKTEPKNDELEFADIGWTRSGESDTEFIGFNSDGTFYYYCACGNPVNDSDLCESYTYDSKNETISLNCMDQTYEIVTEIKIVSYSEEKLVLDFDGDIREFGRDLDE